MIVLRNDKGRRHCGDNVLGNDLRVTSCLDIRQEQHELVASEARDDVGFTHAVAHPLCGIAEYDVACGMPGAVVDALEEIEIDEQQRATLLGAMSVRQGALQLVAEVESVWKR